MQFILLITNLFIINSSYLEYSTDKNTIDEIKNKSSFFNLRVNPKSLRNIFTKKRSISEPTRPKCTLPGESVEVNRTRGYHRDKNLYEEIDVCKKINWDMFGRDNGINNVPEYLEIKPIWKSDETKNECKYDEIKGIPKYLEIKPIRKSDETKNECKYDEIKDIPEYLEILDAQEHDEIMDVPEYEEIKDMPEYEEMIDSRKYYDIRGLTKYNQIVDSRERSSDLSESSSSKLISLDYEIPLTNFSKNKKDENKLNNIEPYCTKILTDNIHYENPNRNYDDIYNKFDFKIKESNEKEKHNLEHIYENIDFVTNQIYFSCLNYNCKLCLDAAEMFQKIDKGLKNIMKLFMELKKYSLINKDLYILMGENYKTMYNKFTNAVLDYNLNHKYDSDFLNLNLSITEFENFLLQSLKFDNYAQKFKSKLHKSGSRSTL